MRYALHFSGVFREKSGLFPDAHLNFWAPKESDPAKLTKIQSFSFNQPVLKMKIGKISFLKINIEIDMAAVVDLYQSL